MAKITSGAILEQEIGAREIPGNSTQYHHRQVNETSCFTDCSYHKQPIPEGLTHERGIPAPKIGLPH